jgi:hypothetical protein
MTNRLPNLGIIAALALLLSTPALAADGVKVNELVSRHRSPTPNATRPSTLPARSTISGTPAMTLC